MSNALAIATVTTVLQDVLLNALLRAPVEERIDAAEVMTAYPGSEPLVNGGKPRVNLYLYHVAPNASFRNNDASARTDRVALDLYYLLSFHGNEDACEPQRLLGLTVRALAANAVLSRGVIERTVRNVAAIRSSNKRFVVGSDLAKSVELVNVTPTPLSLEEMAKIWSVFFQTKYTLSVAYQCSAVFVESAAPAAPRPTLVRNSEVIAVQQPIIENVISAHGPEARITSGSDAVILGNDLLGQWTTLHLGNMEIRTFVEARPNRIRFTVPPGLRAGIQGIQVVHQLVQGTPPTPHPGFESPPVGMVLCPVLTRLTRTAYANPHMVLVAAQFTPAIGKNQRATLLLRQGNSSAPPRVFTAPARDHASDPEETATLVFPVTHEITPGRYSASLLIDGAESPLLEVELS
jgi:hypothetical protein